MRRLSTSLIVAAVVTVVGHQPKASGQGGPYAIRGGPIYGGPIYGGGPSLFVGGYSQPYFGPQLSGAGYGAMFLGRYPQFNAVQANAALPYYAGNMTMNPTAGVVYQPPLPKTSTGGQTVPQPQPSGRPGSTEGAPANLAQTPAATGTAAPGTTAPATAPLPNARPVQPAIGRARFNVNLPADAKLWVNDAPTTQAGGNRRFHTPPELDPLRTYEYVFRAQWADGNQVVTRDKTVRFKAGDDLAVDFNQAAAR